MNPYQTLLDRQRECFLSDATKPLAPYIVSLNQKTIDPFLASVSFAGGAGLSGMGKCYGQAGFDALSNTKSLLVGNPDEVLDVFPQYAGKHIAKNLSVFA